jgi:hypothetical protein
MQRRGNTRFMTPPGIPISRNNNRDDNMTCRHPNSTNSQDRLSPKFVNVENRGNCSEEHNDAHDAGSEQGGGV